jgi:hypothetical protein
MSNDAKYIIEYELLPYTDKNYPQNEIDALNKCEDILISEKFTRIGIGYTYYGETKYQWKDEIKKHVTAVQVLECKECCLWEDVTNKITNP